MGARGSRAAAREGQILGLERRRVGARGHGLPPRDHEPRARVQILFHWLSVLCREREVVPAREVWILFGPALLVELGRSRVSSRDSRVFGQVALAPPLVLKP